MWGPEAWYLYPQVSAWDQDRSLVLSAVSEDLQRPADFPGQLLSRYVSGAGASGCASRDGLVVDGGGAYSLPEPSASGASVADLEASSHSGSSVLIGLIGIIAGAQSDAAQGGGGPRVVVIGSGVVRVAQTWSSAAAAAVDSAWISPSSVMGQERVWPANTRW